MVTSIILIRMRRFISIFRSAGAIDASRAIIPQEYGINTGFAFQKLVREGILLSTDGERFYMDEERETLISNRRRKIVIILIAIILLFFVIGTIFSLI